MENYGNVVVNVLCRTLRQTVILAHPYYESLLRFEIEQRLYQAMWHWYM